MKEIIVIGGFEAAMQFYKALGATDILKKMIKQQERLCKEALRLKKKKKVFRSRIKRLHRTRKRK
jgi:hypothetical protein